MKSFPGVNVYNFLSHKLFIILVLYSISDVLNSEIYPNYKMLSQEHFLSLCHTITALTDRGEPGLLSPAWFNLGSGVDD